MSFSPSVSRCFFFFNNCLRNDDNANRRAEVREIPGTDVVVVDNETESRRPCQCGRIRFASHTRATGRRRAPAAAAAGAAFPTSSSVVRRRRRRRSRSVVSLLALFPGVTRPFRHRSKRKQRLSLVRKRRVEMQKTDVELLATSPKIEKTRKPHPTPQSVTAVRETVKSNFITVFDLPRAPAHPGFGRSKY